MPRLLEFESVIHSVALEAYMRLPMIVEVSLRGTYLHLSFNKFLTNHLTVFWHKICYFYILQTKSNLDRIFYKIVYYHIIYV